MLRFFSHHSVNTHTHTHGGYNFSWCNILWTKASTGQKKCDNIRYTTWWEPSSANKFEIELPNSIEIHILYDRDLIIFCKDSNHHMKWNIIVVCQYALFLLYHGARLSLSLSLYLFFTVIIIVHFNVRVWFLIYNYHVLYFIWLQCLNIYRVANIEFSLSVIIREKSKHTHTRQYIV